MSGKFIECGLPKADQYQKDVLSGKIDVPTYVLQAVERNQRDLRKAESDPDFPYYFEPREAQRFFDFCKKFIKHYEGRRHYGRPLILEPWQCFCFGMIMGWVQQKEDVGLVRRYKNADLFVPKKNGKSFVGAALALYMTMWDLEPGAEVYALAKNRSHASDLSYGAAKEIVQNSEELSKLLKINRSIANLKIEYEDLNSSFKPLPSRPEALDGRNVHCSVMDEIKDLTDGEVFDVIEYGTASRDNALLLSITTAGPNTNSVGFQRYKLAKKILSGEIPEDECRDTFCIIYEADEEDIENWDKEAVWEKVNPNYGVSVRKEYFKSTVNKAKNSVRKKNEFLTKHLNSWGKSSSGWLDIAKWDDCSLDIEIEDLKHLPAIVSVDLASKRDLSIVQIIFYEGSSLSELTLYPFTYSFVPKERLTSNSKEGNDKYISQLKSWESEGWLTTAGIERTDYDHIRDIILDLFKEYNVECLAYDPSEATMLVSQLEKRGIDPNRNIKITMTPRNMSEPMKTLEAMIHSKNVKHDDNPVLRWCMSNVITKTNHKDQILPDKESKDEKIDAAVTLIQGLAAYKWFFANDDTKVNPWAVRAEEELKQEGEFENEDEQEEEIYIDNSLSALEIEAIEQLIAEGEMTREEAYG